MNNYFITENIEEYKKNIKDNEGVLVKYNKDLIEEIFNVFQIDRHSIPKNSNVLKRSKNNYLVVTFEEEDDWIDISKIYAEKKMAEFLKLSISNLNQLFDRLNDKNLEYIAFIGKKEKFDESFLQKIKFFQMDNLNKTNFSYGFIIGTDTADLTFQIFKTLNYQNLPNFSDLLIGHNKDFEEYDKNLVDFFNSSKDKIDYKSPLDSFLFHGHGREDHLFILDGYICPLSDEIRNISNEKEYKKLPSCAINNECYKPYKDIVKTNNIKSKIVFLNSCSSFRLNKGIFENGYSVSEGFRKSWPAVIIGSSVIKDGSSIENLYFHKMLKANLSVGKIVNALNFNAWKRGNDFFNFTIIGDPEFKLNKKYNTDIQYINKSDENYIINTETEVISINENKLNSSYITSTTKEKVFDVIRNERGELYKDFFKIEKFSKSEEVKLHYRNFYIKDYIKKQLVVRLRNINQLGLYGLYDKKIENQVQDLNQQLHGLVKQINIDNFHKTSISKIEEKLKKIEKKINIVENKMIELASIKTYQENYHFNESYHEFSEITSVQESQYNCPYCNNVTYRIVYEGITLEHFKRINIKCPACGVIADIPDSQLNVEINYNKYNSLKEEIEFVVNINNQKARNSKSLINSTILEGNRYNFHETKKNETGNQVKTAFKLDENAPRHLYYGRTYIIHEGGIYYFNYPFWIN